MPIPSVSVYIRRSGTRKYERVSTRSPQALNPGDAYVLHVWNNGHRKWTTVGTDLQEALTRRSDEETKLFIHQKYHGVPKAEPVRVTIQERLKVYLADVEATKKPKTVAGYTHDLNRFTASVKKRYVDEITEEDLQQFTRDLRKEGLGKRSVYNTFQSVNTFLRFCKCFLGKEILKKLGNEYTEPDVVAYTKEEVAAIFNACDDEERLVWRFFLESGCREQEVANAVWGDIDFNAGTLHVKSTIAKDKESRDIPLSDNLLADLNAWRGKRGRNDLIFPNEQGGVEGHFLRKLKTTVDNAGLDIKVGLHKWRKTFACWHSDEGVPMPTLMDWLGHSDLSVTQRYLKGWSAKTPQARKAANSTFASVSRSVYVEQTTEAIQ